MVSPETLQALFAAAPWAAVAALVVWPKTGIIALWIKARKAIKLAEIERQNIQENHRHALEKRGQKELLPAPQASLPAPKGDGDDDSR